MRKMRDSGVAWIGDVPEGWGMTTVKRIYEKVKSKAHQDNPVVLSLARSGVHVRNMESALGQFAESYFDYNPVLPGDLLLNPMDLYSGANCSISEVAGVISPAYVNLRPIADVNSIFYDYYFKVQYWTMAFFAHGSGVSFDNRWTLTSSALRNFPVVLPPKPEQDKIATFLKEACADIDSSIGGLCETIGRIKAWKRSYIATAVCRGIGKRPELVESGVDWIGKVPKHWRTLRIVNLYREVSERGDDSLPILSVSINTGVSDKELSDDEQERVFIRSEDKTKYKRVQPGDLTYNMMRAWQGAFGAVRVNGMVSPAYVVARPKVELDSRYMEYLMRAPNAMSEIHRYSRGIADFRLRLYWPEFKNIRIPCPPLKEQREIADEIDAKCAEADALISEQEKLIADLEVYKKSLIFEVVTGKREVA